MKFTNEELTRRMIHDQQNGWPYCPRCGKIYEKSKRFWRIELLTARSKKIQDGSKSAIDIICFCLIG